MDITISKATGEDIPALQKLACELFKYVNNLGRHFNVEWMSGENAGDYFSDGILDGYVWIAKSDTKAVGYLLGNIYEAPKHFLLELIGEIDDLFILSDFRNQQIGKKFIDLFVEECKKYDVDRVRVSLVHNNKDTASFYKHLGFGDCDITLEKRL